MMAFFVGTCGVFGTVNVCKSNGHTCLPWMVASGF